MATNQTWQNKMLGRYRMLRLLGRGGMGEVWLAQDTQLLRQVAVKLLPTVHMGDQNYLQVFEREARAAAALEHPHILPIHDFGELPMQADKIVTYLITPFVDSGSLQDRFDHADGPLPPLEALNFLRQAAQAIDYAHSRQVLHRDIKPANMLLQQSWLFLADFGLAKMLTSTTQGNRTFAGSGTPEYMAPEQVQGKAEPASDRYSFAITAYQLLAGRVPFKGETVYSTMLKQMNQPPPSPRQFNLTLPKVVEQALLQGLAKAPTDRPPTCLTLVTELEQGWPSGTSNNSSFASQHNTPVSSPDFPSQEVTQRYSYTNMPAHHSHQPSPTPDPLTPPLSPDAPTSLANLAHTPQTPSPLSQDAPTYPSGASQLPTQQPVRPRFTRRALIVGGGAVVALAAVASATALYPHFSSSPQPYSSSATPTVTLSRPTPGPAKLGAGIPLLSLAAHQKELTIARWDPTGRYLATGSLDATVMLWDLASPLASGSGSVQSLSRPLRTWNLPCPLFANRLCWSADGRSLAVLIADPQGNDRIALYDPFSTSSNPRALYHIADISAGKLAYPAIAWSPTASSFATPSFVQGQQQQRVALWHTNNTTAPARTLTANVTGTPRTIIYDNYKLDNSFTNLNALAWSTDGKRLATHTNSGSVILWDTTTGSVQTTLNLPTRPIPANLKDSGTNTEQVENESLAWSPTSPSLLAVSDVDIMTLWDVQTSKLLLTLQPKDPVFSQTALTWSSNGTYLAASFAGSAHVAVWNIQAATTTAPGSTQTPLLTFPQAGVQVHKQSIADLDWSPDGRYIVTASADTTAVVWQIAG